LNLHIQMKNVRIGISMKPIILDGPDYISCQIKMVEGEIPYLGVEVHDPRLTAPANWHYLEDKDLYRLELAIKKCRKAYKKWKKGNK